MTSIALCLLATACINLNVTRSRTNAPLPAELVDSIHPGRTSFGEALARLGAPEIVWASETGDIVLAYVWTDQLDWGISFSYAFQDFVSAGLSWEANDIELPGVVLVFRPDLELRSVRRGFLRDLLPVPEEADPALEALANIPG
ncbi:MAG: hypothetical protein IPM29_32045 [Planctomycetes bacterium]|nr:hypothetical protein [Planctomycetota bacterium]